MNYRVDVSKSALLMGFLLPAIIRECSTCVTVRILPP